MKTFRILLIAFFPLAHLPSAFAADAPLGKIIAINTEWHFALVNAGDEKGIEEGMNLVVETKGGIRHACKIVEIMQNQTVIEFNPDIQPGLRVDNPVVSQQKPKPEQNNDAN